MRLDSPVPVRRLRVGFMRLDILAVFTSALLGGVALAAAVEPLRVEQRAKMFEPSTLSLTRGAVVRINNDDPFIHHIYVDSPAFKFDSGDHRPGRIVEIRFEEPGDYVVQCAIHLKMRLHVSVR